MCGGSTRQVGRCWRERSSAGGGARVWLLAACAVRGLAVAAAPAQAVTFSQQTLAFGGLNQPRSVAVDAAVDVFLADAGNNRIVELPAGGSQRTVSLGVTLSFPAGVRGRRNGRPVHRGHGK